jgi:hypothetical protein
VNGDVTSAPFTGATTEIPELSFALIEADGVAHPVIANARQRPEKLNKVSALTFQLELLCFRATLRAQASEFEAAAIRILPHFPAPDGIRAPNMNELDRGAKKAISAGIYRSPRKREE